MKPYAPIILSFIVQSTFSVSAVKAQQTDVYTTPSTWTVPNGVNIITIKAYGGAGGVGGQDCGAGCTNALAGPVGYVVADYAVTSGTVVGIFPGGKGGTGLNASTSSGGGAGGLDTYTPVNYNGGMGGNAGNSGTSGGGGGGGAASVITLNSTIQIIAGGAGGGGGMANQAGSGSPGVTGALSNSVTSGGAGTTPAGDGGGGGGGGGGQFASSGGNVHAAGSEKAGDGGYRGANSITGANAVTANSSITWTAAGRIEITYTNTLPLTWLTFRGTPINNGVFLDWSTVNEQNTRDFLVQRSGNAIDWMSIDILPASGNSIEIRHYNYFDRTSLTGTRFYRLVQRDQDGNSSYSRVVTVGAQKVIPLIHIYPNPVVTELTVVLGGSATFSIYDFTGRKMLTEHLTAGSHLLNVARLSAGEYIFVSENECIKFMKR